MNTFASITPLQVERKYIKHGRNLVLVVFDTGKDKLFLVHQKAEVNTIPPKMNLSRL